MIDGLETASNNNEAKQAEKQRQNLILRKNMLSFRHNRNFKI
jgi:hypothetical protein